MSRILRDREVEELTGLCNERRRQLEGEIAIPPSALILKGKNRAQKTHFIVFHQERARFLYLLYITKIYFFRLVDGWSTKKVLEIVTKHVPTCC